MSTTAVYISLKEVQSIVDELCTFLASSDHTNDPRIAEQVKSYAEAVKYINARLQRCGDLLQKGYRSEALMLAQIEPDLTTLVRVVQKLDTSKLSETSGNYGWERAQPLKQEIAGYLNDAMVTENKLLPLLKKHCFLALSRSPLMDRLTILRQLMQEDHTLPIWREDVALFESERARQLNTQGQKAYNVKNYELLDNFLNDYKREAWVNPPPEGLKQLYSRCMSIMHMERTLPNIAGEIYNGINRGDRKAIVEAHERWKKTVDEIKEFFPQWYAPADYAQLIQRAEMVSQEVAEQNRREAFHIDLHELRLALQREASPDQVALLTAKAESHGYSLSKDVINALAAYHRELEHGKGITFVMIVSVILAAVVLITVAFLLVKTSNPTP